jgi:hypothetical protein
MNSWHAKYRLHLLISGLFMGICLSVRADSPLEEGWQKPPLEARLRAYWWWLNGNVTKASITQDLEQMRAKGFGGAVLFDADGASLDGNKTVPHGPTFFSPEWRELFKHTLREADRLGLEISLNIQSGWNLGGPMVKTEDAAKKYVWTEIKITGDTSGEIKLPQPRARDNFYRDIAVIAFPLKKNGATKPLVNWKIKALQEQLKPSSAPDTAPFFAELPSAPGEQTTNTGEVLDLTTKLQADGTLKWNPPAGDWQLLRFGYTIGDHAYVSTSSGGWKGYALDVYSAQAFQHYWQQIVAPLIADAGPHAGKSLKYLHTDSWEIELANWTPKLRAEFQLRRGYDLLSWLPVLAGRIVNSREESNRFLFDYRQTLGDLAIDGHYRLFRDNARQHDIGIHPESGGPHAVPIDAQRCLGWNDAPMSEFWAWSWKHRIGDDNRFFVKQPASAAHTYGHKLVLAEGFTTIGPHWQEKLRDNLKPSFEKALCEGLNVLVWHAFVNSPDSEGIPGQQYFAGTHLNPKVTWWEKSGPFFSYINRCQFLLQQGKFCADVLYYYGDHVPNFTQHKKTDPLHLQPGYDYDVITAEALIDRASVKDGKIVLPDGIAYRLLVLPDRDQISLPVLKKLKELAAAGATIVGKKPVRGESLGNAATRDTEVKQIAETLWANPGKGRVISDKSVREVLKSDGIGPDCEFNSPVGDGKWDYIHRTTEDTDIYFVTNQAVNAAKATVTFRVSEQAPELWNPVTGERKFAAAYTAQDGRVAVPLDFAPCGSWFVVFRQPAAAHPATASTNSPEWKPLQEISGAWTVHFDPKWGGPATSSFDTLVSWPESSEPGIKFYSGTAVYEKSLNLPDHFDVKNSRLWLDLGSVYELAEVKLNGKSCGVLWCAPWRVDVSDAIKPGENKLEIAVVNFWPNRLIGDAALPEAKRLTRTNITKLTAMTPLEPAGLLGPVRLLQSQ